MSNHEQTQESLATYLAGGLSPKERADIEQHLAGCGDCSKALADARKLEQAMADLFAADRPDVELEARALAGLRKSRIRRASILRFVGAAAAVLIVGLVGSVVQVFAFAEFRKGGSETQAEVVLIDGSESMDGKGKVYVATDGRGRDSDRLASTYYSQSRGGFRVVDVDPAKQNMDKESQYQGDRREEVSVPGSQTPTAGFGLGTGSMAPLMNTTAPGDGRVQFAPVFVDSHMHWAVPNKTFSGRSGATRENAVREGGGSSVDESKRISKLEKGIFNIRVQPESWGAMPAPEKAGKAELGFTTVGRKIGATALGDGENTKLALGGDRGYYRGSVALEPKPPAPPRNPRGGDELPDSVKPATINYPELKAKEEVALLLEKKAEPKLPDPMPETVARIIYTGEMEFEIDSFDAGIKKVKELITARNAQAKPKTVAFMSKEDSKKLENGKKRGYLIVRIQPELLDKFIDDLRNELGKLGELRTQHVSSADVTLQYTDTESTLKAARAVEGNLLKIIETKKGDIKDLVAAEATLGEWRTKIEKLEGQMRVLRNQIALSTLTITLVEKDIGTPASLVVTEKVQMRIEVDEVKKALESAIDALKGVKGRVLKSELKQHKAGQFEAILHAEVPPAQKDAFAKKLSELGIVSENEATQKTQAEGGSGKPGKIEPRVNDVVFEVALNNIVNIKPRHAVNIDLATKSVPDSYKKLKDVLASIPKAQIRVDNLNEQDKLRITAQLEFSVPADKKDAINKAIDELGKVLKKTSTQAAVTEVATEQKFGFVLSLLGPASIAPRETVTLKVEVKDVDQRIEELKKSVQAGNGRVADSNVIRQENGQVSAILVLDVPLAVQNLIVLKVKESGNLLHQQSVRNPNIPESELATARIEVTLNGVFAGKPPRETVHLVFEVGEVAKTASELKELVKAINGRVADGKVEQMPNGQMTTELEFDVPLAVHETLVKQFKDGRKELSYKTATNASVPDNELATARIKVLLTTPRPIGPSDSGMGSFTRRSLDWSFTIFSYCILAIIAGLSAIIPVGIVIYLGYKAIWWMWPASSAAAKPAS